MGREIGGGVERPARNARRMGEQQNKRREREERRWAKREDQGAGFDDLSRRVEVMGFAVHEGRPLNARGRRRRGGPGARPQPDGMSLARLDLVKDIVLYRLPG